MASEVHLLFGPRLSVALHGLYENLREVHLSVAIRDLRHRITFQNLSLTPDGQGGGTEVWTDIVDTPTVWAKIKPRSAAQRFYSQQIKMDVSHEIVVRFRSDLREGMRIVHEGRFFQIHGIRNEDEKRFFTYLDCMEGVAS